MLRTAIIGVGTATPPTAYSQHELLDYFDITDQRIRRLFLNGSINQRYLTLPDEHRRISGQSESQGELLKKHKVAAMEIGAQAIYACLDSLGATVADIAYLCCVTTTGFLCPSISALLTTELGITSNCVRLDVVGMGCNAGLNALNAAQSWAHANAGKLALLLCVEICSAGYVFDQTIRTAVVNSLFGDGAAAVALAARSGNSVAGSPAIIKFHSYLISETVDSMRYDWDESHGKFSFYLDPNIPYVIGAHIEQTIDALLSDTGLRRSDIKHWIVHSGGKKVIDAIKINLGLSYHDLRHTLGVLRDYGNLSSGSFLFSYQRLLNERITVPGDYGVMITMGPGCTIESAILQW